MRKNWNILQNNQAEIKDQSLNLRPVGSFGAKHGPDTPARPKHVEWLRETVIVNDACVDGEDPHQKDDVAPSKNHVEHLQKQTENTEIWCFWLLTE